MGVNGERGIIRLEWGRIEDVMGEKERSGGGGGVKGWG